MTGTPSAAAIHHAVHDVLGTPSYRAVAASLQQAYARRDGVAEIARVIDEAIAERQPVAGRHG